MDTQASIFDTFTAEFCPPLDSSLIAALLADIETDSNCRRTSPTQAQINELRSTLRELAAQADVSQLSEFSNLQLTSPTDASGSNFDFYIGDTGSSRTSEFSASSQDVLASQLGFLQAALPNVKEKRLKSALAQAALNDDEPDLWSVISSILSDEAVRELQERDPEGLGDNNVHNTMFADDISWDAIESRKQSGRGKKAKRKQKITLIDVRQQHHARPAPKNPTSATDPWAVVVSVAEQLSNLVPSRPASYFQSYFHSPVYSTPYEAACAALTAIHDVGSTLDDDAVLVNLVDIISPDHEEMLDTNQRSILCSDIQLAINVTRGHTDDALDLVRILRDLDSDSKPGYMEMGIYHAPSQPGSPRLASPPVSSHITKLPAGPPEAPPPPEKAKSPPSGNRRKRSSSEPQWQTVPQRKTPHNDMLQVITCRSANTRDAGAKIKGSGNSLGKGGKGDVGELAEHNRRIKENLRKRDECYKEAHAMWRKGNAKTRGGEVAMFYVERAKEYQELVRKEALNAARDKVQAKRRASDEKDTIDLHGVTVAEAIIIVKEELEEMLCSYSRPLKIITGRGSHSANQVSVLKPKVREALNEDGWSVGVWEGGLIVRGRKAGA